MSQKKLDLFQFSAGSVAEASARPAEIVRGQFAEADRLLRLRHR
jgi:hypothetical protein